MAKVSFFEPPGTITSDAGITIISLSKSPSPLAPLESNILLGKSVTRSYPGITRSNSNFTEKSLSVTNIKSLRGELFYWTAILFSNTLGTALGDFLADNSGLGFAGGAILIGSLLVLLVLSYYFSKVSHIILFWLAFVLTRPFGATFGDLLTKTHEKGGLDFGTVGSSSILFTILVVMVAASMIKVNKENKISGTV